jgi:hypothetical protein
MKRKNLLQKILNKTLKPQIIKMFGEGSFVTVSNITYVRSKKCHLINVTLYLTDVENGMEIFPDGLEIIIKQAWDVIGDKKPIMIQSSLDVPQ